ncbi:hypothetical protein U703_10045 [Rhodobacter capsulatus YW1]|nr:hypothetical protein U703_10045 [Rhodobacter capsulatus YW1]
MHFANHDIGKHEVDIRCLELSKTLQEPMLEAVLVLAENRSIDAQQRQPTVADSLLDFGDCQFRHGR